jgi:hypothetical protein
MSWKRIRQWDISNEGISAFYERPLTKGGISVLDDADRPQPRPVYATILPNAIYAVLASPGGAQ